MPYPPKGILAEVGRVAIAGARLDYQLFQIWRHLDPDLHDAGKKTAAHRERVVAARSRPNQYQEVIKRRAREHLVEHWAAYVIGVGSQASCRCLKFLSSRCRCLTILSLVAC